jgi:WD40-like Beta Propeller Repeat
MGRRGTVAAGAALLLTALSMGVAPAAVPDGPRLAFVAVDGSRSGGTGVESTGPSGADPQSVVRASSPISPLPFALSPLSWSGDGSAIAFSGVGNRKAALGVAVVGADGARPRFVPHTQNALYPAFGPDGSTIAFLGIHSRRKRSTRSRARAASRRLRTALFTISTHGDGLRRLTPWRDGIHLVPSSFSPDGSQLAVSRVGAKGRSDVLALRTDGSGSTVLARNAEEPAYSPDGSRIAVVREAKRPKGPNSALALPGTDVYVINVDGSGLSRVTHTPARTKQWPSWDPSGQRLVFTQVRRGLLGLLTGIGDALMEVNADGTCPTKVLAGKPTRFGFYGAAWQPGPGREAGRISC